MTPEGGGDHLLGVFGQEILDQIPADLKTALDQKWTVFHQNLEEERIKVEKDNVLKETQVFELERDLDLTRQKLESTLQSQSLLNGDKEALTEKCQEAQQKIENLQEKSQLLSEENGSLKRERDQLQGERNDVIGMAERRLTEIERLQKEVQSLSNQLLEANNAKCEAIVKVEEIASKEIVLEYKEKRIQEEREYMNAQIQTLSSQLSQTNDEIIRVRSEQSQRLAQLSSDLAQKSEEVGMLEGREEALKADLENANVRCEELAERLKAARESEIAVEENYRQEVRAQTKLAELYKNHCDDSEKKAADLAKVVEELQDLVKQTSDRYGKLEDCLESERLENKEELKRRNEAIRALRKELTDANDLIKTLKTKGLTEEGIEKLSPSAAAASKLLKSGMSLTQIYSQLVTCQEELIQAKDDNTRLNSYLDQILKEIEERAPIMKQQREDYERAVDAVSSLTRQLEDARHEYEFRKREALDARQKSEAAQRENRRRMTQVQDLGRQVAVLVREVEAARAGFNTSRHPLNTSSTDMNQSGDADAIISDRLVSFRDVAELQQKNIELLSVVRELSSNQESAENRVVEEKTAELKRELEMASAQVEELRAARQRQEVMVESIINERDMYKSIATGGGTEPMPSAPMATSTPGAPLKSGDATISSPSPAKTKTPYHELEKKAISAEASLAEVKKEFDLYREEKCENLRMIEDELKKTREELQDKKTKFIKLASQEEFNNERYKTAQANAQAYKKQMEILNERSTKLSAIVAKHESTIELLRNEVLAAQSKLSQSEVQLDFLKHEKGVLKAAEARLIQENEILHRQKTSSSMVMENLNLVKLNLERQEQERNMRLENKNEALEKEVALLRKKLDAEEENYKQAVQAWEKAQNDLRLKLDEAMANEKEAVEKVANLQTQFDESRLQLTETQEKLELAESSLAGRGVKAMSRQESQPEVSAKVRDLQLQLTQSKNEVNNLKIQLNSSKEACANFKNLAESAEKRLSENNVAEKALKTDLENRLQQALETKSALEAKLVELQQAKIGSGEEINLKETLLVTQNNLQTVSAQLVEAQRIEVECRAEVERQKILIEEAQQNYERELVLHSKDVETMNGLKTIVNSHRNVVHEKEEALKDALESLSEVKANASQVEESLKTEYAQLHEQFKIVEEENKSLHNQLATITEQMTSIQRHVEGNPDASKSFSEEDTKSTEQLMQVIKYLRREKEILNSKIEVAQAECARVKSQSEHFQKQLNESQAVLAREREQSSTSAMSSSKYADLLQKVQTNSALSDSNKILREENEALNGQLKSAQADVEIWKQEVNPIKDRIKVLEEKENTLNTELIAAKREVEKWKQRSNQLIEKQQMMNPETVKAMQNDISSLTQQLEKARLMATKHKGDADRLSVELNRVKAQLSKLVQDIKGKVAEIGRLNQEQKKLMENCSQLESKLSAMDREKNSVVSERDTIKQELLREKNRNANLQKSDGIESEKVKKELVALKEQDAKRNIELENYKKKLLENKTQITRLKQVGRDFKEKSDKFQQELIVLREEKAKLAAEMASGSAKTTSTASGSTPEGSDEELRAKVTELEKKNEEGEALIAETMKELESKDAEITELNDKLGAFERDLKVSKMKEKRALDVLKACKVDITRIKTENKDLKTENTIMRTKNNLPPRQPGPSRTEFDAQKTEFENKLKTLGEQKDKLEAEYKEEREKLQQQIEALQQELQSNQKQLDEALNSQEQQQQQQQIQQQQQQQNPPPQQQQGTSSETKPSTEAVTASVKPMAGSSGTQRKQTSYPQAQVHPTRHVPAATIRPTAMRTPQQASVQPMVSVSPNSASQSTSTTTTHSAITMMTPNLNPNASEFIPRIASVPSGSGETVESSDESTPRARVLPRSQDSDSDSGPSSSAGPGSTTQPSGGASGGPTGGPPANQKRPRDDPPDSDSNNIKRIRTVAGEAEEIRQGSVPPPSSTTQEEDDGEEVEIVSLEGAEPEAMEDESDEDNEEEELDEDPGDVEEDENRAPMDEVDDPNERDEGEIDDEDNDEEEEDDDVEDEEEDESMQQGDKDDDVVQVEDTDDEDSSQYQVPEQSDEGVVAAVVSGAAGESEPSSSSTRQGHEGGNGDGRSHVSSVTLEDQGDSVVPGTPKLSQPQSDLFGGITSEQSAQASSSEGGTFGFGSIPDVAVSSSSGGTTTATLAARDGVDRTAVDIAQFVQATESSSTMGQPRASTSQTKGSLSSQLSNTAVDIPARFGSQEDVVILDDDSNQSTGSVSTSAQRLAEGQEGSQKPSASEIMSTEQVQSSEGDLDQGSSSQAGPSQSQGGAVSSSNRPDVSAVPSTSAGSSTGSADKKRLNRNRIVFDLNEDNSSSSNQPPAGRGGGAGTSGSSFRGMRGSSMMRGNPSSRGGNPGGPRGGGQKARRAKPQFTRGK